MIEREGAYSRRNSIHPYLITLLFILRSVVNAPPFWTHAAAANIWTQTALRKRKEKSRKIHRTIPKQPDRATLDNLQASEHLSEPTTKRFHRLRPQKEEESPTDHKPEKNNATSHAEEAIAIEVREKDEENESMFQGVRVRLTQHSSQLES